MCFFWCKTVWILAHAQIHVSTFTITLTIQNSSISQKTPSCCSFESNPPPALHPQKLQIRSSTLCILTIKLIYAYSKELKIYTLVHKFKSQCVPILFTNSVHSKLINIIVWYVPFYNFIHDQFINHLYIYIYRVLYFFLVKPFECTIYKLTFSILIYLGNISRLFGGFPGGTVVNLPASAGDMGLIPGSGR